MKHFHLLMVVLTLGAFIYSSVAIIRQKPLGKVYQIASHVIYTLVVVTGAFLLWQLSQVAGVQHWAYAKIVLLIVAISAMIKARKNPATAKAGILLSWIALIAILGLAITKPILGA